MNIRQFVVVCVLYALSGMNLLVSLSVIYTGVGTRRKDFHVRGTQIALPHHKGCLWGLLAVTIVVVGFVEFFAAPLFGHHVTWELLAHWLFCAIAVVAGVTAVIKNGVRHEKIHGGFGHAAAASAICYSITGFMVTYQMSQIPFLR
jgi:hypothetical protein